MKIAIISDIHDNLVNLEKTLDWCRDNTDALICCGDVTNGETVTYLAENYERAIHLVRGNADSYGEIVLRRFAHLSYHARAGRIEVLGKHVGLCHEPFLLDKVIEKGACDIVFYGHTHKPWEEEKKGARFVNPGTLGGMFQMATFAVYDVGEDDLVLQIVDRI